MGGAQASTARGAAFLRGRLPLAADWIAAAVVFSLPWSTSATSILIVVWLIAALPGMDADAAKRWLRSPAAMLPVALWAFACLGTLWADVSWPQRLEELRGFHKLLVIPLLLIHFSRSDNWPKAMAAFLASSTILLLYSWASLRWPALVFGAREPGIPVKDYIYQNLIFVLSVAALAHIAISKIRTGAYWTAAFSVGLAAAFVANLVYVLPSRTGLALLPVVLALVGYQRVGLKGGLTMIAVVAVLATAAWQYTPYFQVRTTLLVEGVLGKRGAADTSESERLRFWRAAFDLMREAPVFGHGIGVGLEKFAKAVDPAGGGKNTPIINPHNQTFMIGMPLGLVGIGLLYAMWLSHFLLFRGEGWAAWLGTLVVVQNVVASLFNSHISDFTAGWLYVFGVGVLGGAMARQRLRGSPEAGRPEPGGVVVHG